MFSMTRKVEKSLPSSVLDFTDGFNFNGDTFNNLFEPPMTFKVDVIEKEREFELNCELPGVDKEDLSVKYEDGSITISAKRNQPVKKDGETILRREIAYGKVERRFSVGQVKPENIKASYKDGVLTVTLEKDTEEETFKNIEIS